MSTQRTVRLTPAQLALKLATAEGVRAAGGQVFVGRECGRSQGRISDYCSTSIAEFAPLDVAATIDTLGAGSPGHPHITRALARAQGAVLELVPDAPAEAAEPSFGERLARISREVGDLNEAIVRQNLALACSEGSPAGAVAIVRECVQLRAQLDALEAGVLGDTVVPIGRRDTS